MDWDGTCVPNAWPAQPKEWLPGAVDALHALSKFSRVVIHTARIAPLHMDEQTPRAPGEVWGEINYIRQMLDDAGLHAIRVWDKPWKPGAIAYVDDKARRYSGRPGAWKALVPLLGALCGQRLIEFEEDSGEHDA